MNHLKKALRMIEAQDEEWTDEQVTHEDGLDRIKAEYTPRIIALMEEMKGLIETRTPYKVTEPAEIPREDFVWGMEVLKSDREGDPKDNPIISFAIVDAQDYASDEFGMDFGIGVRTVGGAFLDELTPLRGFETLWLPVEDVEAIERRFEEMKDFEVEDLMAVVE